jgi:hypothetical protein
MQKDFQIKKLKKFTTIFNLKRNSILNKILFKIFN